MSQNLKSNLEDIQAIIFAGYGHLPLARYVFLRLDDVSKARAWLRTLAGEVTSEQARQDCSKHQPEQAVHAALTASGLRQLGLGKEELATFAEEFTQGLAEKYRARFLGDSGSSAPEHWQFGGKAGTGTAGEARFREIHLVLMLFSRKLDALHAHHRQQYLGHGVTEVFTQDTELLLWDEEEPEGGFRDPFGFRDGITQPVIEGNEPREPQGTRVKPGEIILGYEDGYGQTLPTPTVPARMDIHGQLPSSTLERERKDLGLNGSYLVIRKLKQDVAAFRDFLREHSEEPSDPEGNEAREEQLAARMMGRWRSGAPLVGNRKDPFPRHHKKAWTKDPRTFNYDDFGYHEDEEKDPEELRATRCPVGAHIRRANPRDGLIADDPRASSLVSERHQLIRRGRPYREGAGPQQEEGMLFLALNASLRRQFEFIQHSWLNNPKFGGQYDSRDPITGDNYEEDSSLAGACPASYSFVMADEPVPRRITGLPRFVHVRGGAYFFLPGIRALRFLASLGP